MQTKIQKWGNSLAVRIPKAVAQATGLENNSQVEIRIVEGALHIILPPQARYELDVLLAAITPDNQHEEIETGTAIGNEVW